MDNSVIINKQHLAPIPFVVDGATIKVKDLGGDDLIVMPFSTGATLVRSTELIEFFYQIDDLKVVFTNYDNDADADIDYASLTALMVSMSSGGGGGGGGGTGLTYTTSTVTATTTPQTLLAANPNRKYYSVQAMSGGEVHIGEGFTPTATLASKKLLAKGFYETANVVPTNQLEVRTVTGTNILTITEAQ